MRRRRFLELALIGAAAALAPVATWAHTPYRQWVVYRKRHLLILTSRADPRGVTLGRRVAEVLAEYLPASEARLSRGPHAQRIASLISTKQMDVAILPRADAAALMAGQPPFEDYGPVPLRTIVTLGDHLLICRDDFPDRHAYVVAWTLVANASLLPVPAVVGDGGPVPAHPGALAYAAGRPAPEPPKPKAQ